MSGDASGFKSKAFLVAIGTLTSRVLGLLRDMAMAALFDRRVTDAWTVAFRIPNLFRRVFGEGSMAVSFIPLFIDLQHQDSSQNRARNLLNAFYCFLLVTLSVVTLAGLWGMEPLLKFLLDPAYWQDIEKWILTVKMARIMFGFVFFVVGYSYFSGILQALGEFRWPALAPALFNLLMLIFTFLPASWFPLLGENLAWGVLLGGFAQIALLIPILRNQNYFPQWRWSGFTLDLRRLLVRLLPGLVGAGLVQILTLMNMSFASGMGEGVVSAIYWADRLLELPLSLVAVSLSTTLLPQLSLLWSRGEREQVFQLEAEQLIMNAFWAVPCAFGLYFLAGPIVEVLFYHGEFNAADFTRTVEVLRVYALSLMVMSWTRVLMNMLYASHRVMEAFVVALAVMGLHVWLAPLWIERWGLRGMILSTLLALSVNLLVVVVLISWRMGALPWGRILRQHVQFAFLCLGIVAISFAFGGLKAWVGSASLALLVCMLVGGGFYFVLGRIFRVHEMFDLRRLLARSKG